MPAPPIGEHFLIRRSELREPVAESSGWSVYQFLDDHRDEIGRMTSAQRAVLALGTVHLQCQWVGPLVALMNVEPSDVERAIGAAEQLGRPDMAATLREAAALVPGGYESGDETITARLMAVYEDDDARAAWEPLEQDWGEFGLDLGDFIEQHADEFFVAE